MSVFGWLNDQVLRMTWLNDMVGKGVAAIRLDPGHVRQAGVISRMA
ncbi:hypothetical protein [uncultured Paracoccus sp.]|nr:hypothetical protein [uncultured Paracoccus sp.]